MRTFALALGLTFTLGLTACESEQAEAIEERGEAIDEAYEDAGDAAEEAYEEEAERVDDMIEEGAPAGDRADVIGDGEVFDEPGEPDADELGQ